MRDGTPASAAVQGVGTVMKERVVEQNDKSPFSTHEVSASGWSPDKVPAGMPSSCTYTSSVAGELCCLVAVCVHVYVLVGRHNCPALALLRAERSYTSVGCNLFNRS